MAKQVEIVPIEIDETGKARETSIGNFREERVPITKLHVDLQLNRRHHGNMELDYQLSQMADQILSYGRIVNPLAIEKHGDKYTVLQGNRRLLGAQRVLDMTPEQCPEQYAPRLKEIQENLKLLPVRIYEKLNEFDRAEIIADDGGQLPLRNSEVIQSIFTDMRNGYSPIELMRVHYQGFARLTGKTNIAAEVAKMPLGKERDSRLRSWLNGKLATLQMVYRLGPKFQRHYVLDKLKQERALSTLHENKETGEKMLLPGTIDEQAEWLELCSNEKGQGFELTDTRVKEIFGIVYPAGKGDIIDEAQILEDVKSNLKKYVREDNPSGSGKGTGAGPRNSKAALTPKVMKSQASGMKSAAMQATLLRASGQMAKGKEEINLDKIDSELARQEEVLKVLNKGLDGLKKRDKFTYDLCKLIVSGSPADLELFLKGPAKAAGGEPIKVQDTSKPVQANGPIVK